MTHDTYNVEKDQEFAKQERFFISLSQEKIQVYLDGDPNIDKTKGDKEPPAIVVCMDEGTAMLENGTENVLAIAGSGVLSEPDATAESFVDYAQKRGLTKMIITSHEGCGAAALRYKGDPDSDQKGSAFVDQVVTKMKEIDNNLEVEHRYIPNEEMSRSREFHNAIGVVLDTQKDAYFNPVRLENKPQLFVVHQVPKPDGSPLINELDQVQVACNIAFGDHGFCERFTADKPFTVVVISGETDKAIKMQETKEHLELNDTTRELLDSGRIRIVSYT